MSITRTAAIIDDTIPNIAVLKRILRDMGLEFLEATDGAFGLKIIEEERPILALLDVMMPELNGLEVLDEMQKRKLFQNTAVIVISGADNKETRLEAIGKGALDFISRPFDHEEVRLRVKNAIALKSRELELSRMNENLEEMVSEKVSIIQSQNIELQELNEIKSDFIAVLSHEIRSPIGALIGLIGVLESEMDTMSERQQDYLKRIKRRAGHVQAITNDLLDYFSFQKGTSTMQKLSLCNISDIALSVSESLGGEAEKKSDLIQVDVPFGLTILCDPFKIERMIYNLVFNAVKFTEEGKITISASKTANSAIIKVSDTGCGMPPEKAGTIFEPFNQLDAGKKKRGIGLGLAIVEKIVKLHSGSIAVETKPGQGTTFVITLPQKEGDEI